MASLQTILSTLQSGQFWYLFPHYYYKKLRNFQVLRTEPIETLPFEENFDVPEMHILTGKSHIGDLLFAVKSFFLNYDGQFSLVIHGDQSVNIKSKKIIQYYLPSAKILLKEERDKFVLPKLKQSGLEKCIEFRKTNVFGERLIDTILFSQNSIIINMDTDCLSFSDLSIFKSFIEQDKDVSVYAIDPNPEPYCLSRQVIKEHFGISPVKHFNAGFCALPREVLDLELIEEWLNKFENYPMQSHFAEQTLLAIFANMVENKPLPKGHYNIGRTITENEASFIHYAGHYLSSTRIAMRKIGQSKILNRLKQ